MVMKGISPLIAAVLLIAITVAIATLVSGWISTITRSTQTSVENVTTQAVDCSAAAIVIDDVYVINPGASANVRAIVRNAGQTNDMQLANATLYNNTGGALTAASPTVPVQDFDRGEVVTFEFNGLSIPACPANFQEVIVTTNCGGVFAKFDRSPRCA